MRGSLQEIVCSQASYVGVLWRVLAHRNIGTPGPLTCKQNAMVFLVAGFRMLGATKATASAHATQTSCLRYVPTS
jgi:hypothetical protein